MFLFKNYTKSWALVLCIVLLFSCKKDEGLTDTDDVTTDDTIDDDMPVAGFSGEIEWVNTYGGSGEDDALSIVQAPDGGFVIAGFTSSTDGDITDKTTTDSDYWVFKVNASNQLVWSKTFGGSVDDRATKIITTADGGYAVTGFSRSNDGDVSDNNGFYDFWLIKLDGSGNLQWNKCYGFSGNDQGQSLLQTSDGGYLLVGFIDYDMITSPGHPTDKNSRHGVGEYWAVKIDAQGNEQWSQYYGGTNNDRPYGVTQTQDGGFLLVGNSESNDFDITHPKGSYDFWAVRINSTGQMQWQKNYGGSGIEIAYDILRLDDGNYMVIGDTRSTDQDITNPKGNADVWAIKISDNGNLIWQKNFGGSEFDTGRKVLKNEAGELVIAGTSRSSDQDVKKNYGQSDFWLLITDGSGNIKFEKNYGGSHLDFGNTALISAQGNIVMAGSSQSVDFDVSNNRGSKDVLIIQLKKE